MQLAENNFSVSGRTSNTDLTEQVLEYKIYTVQLVYLWHTKIVSDFLTFDFGPMLQYNSDLELINDQQETFLVKNFDALTANDITKISNFNVNGAIGLTAGVSVFKFKAQYIYGFTNTLGKLNSNNDIDLSSNSNKFKGNQSMLTFSAMISF